MKGKSLFLILYLIPLPKTVFSNVASRVYKEAPLSIKYLTNSILLLSTAEPIKDL